jgi:hypothetical protein
MVMRPEIRCITYLFTSVASLNVWPAVKAALHPATSLRRRRLYLGLGLPPCGRRMGKYKGRDFSSA